LPDASRTGAEPVKELHAMKRRFVIKTTALALGAMLAAASLPAAAEDIDIFTGASGGRSVNPRILIVLDNTSNWARQSQKWPGGATQGQSEVSAIRTVLAGLDDTVSLGLMEFVTGGTANDNGGFIRYAVRPMDIDNKRAFTAELTTIQNDINGTTEKRNSNTPYGNLMYDVYNYFAGSDSYSPGAVLASKADPGGYSSLYGKFASPLTSDNTCGKSFVIVIGNPNQSGPAADSAANTLALSTLNNNLDAKGNLVPVTQLQLPNFSTTSTSSSTQVGTTAACYKNATDAAAELSSFSAACTGFTDGCKIGATVSDNGCSGSQTKFAVLGTDTVITTKPTGTTSTDTGPRNADEWARLLHDKGVPVTGTTIRPSVVTYTIDVYNAQQDPTQTALFMSMAKAGGGKYFAARNEKAIIDALKEIMIEIQSVNTTFASSSLPVSATNRAESENQVFIGMFRPDPDARPRWFGNLKRYKLVRSGSDVELGDVNDKPVTNRVTGFLTACATSFWTFDTGSYWNNTGVSPDPAGTCATTSFNKYSDAPDGPLVEKGGVAEILRQGNVPAGTTQAQAVNRNVYTLDNSGTTLANFSSTTSSLSSSLVRFIRGEDVNDEKGTGQTSTTRPSIHGDVIHSRPLPINYGERGVTVYYGANDGTLRAINAKTGEERWSFIAPEFFPRLARLKDQIPLVAYPFPKSITPTPTPTPKDYFFDGSTGVYQTADNAKVYIFPSMRRGGRMVYALDVTDPAAPRFLWRRGCPNLDNDELCSDGMSKVGQTWSTPAVAFIKGYSRREPIVAFGGGYDRCEDEDSSAPSGCVVNSEKGGAIYILDAETGRLLRTFETERAVAADVAYVDADYDGMPDYLYATDTGGAMYRVDFIKDPNSKQALAPADWTMHMVARTRGGGRKFLFPPAVLPTRGFVYLAIGSGDREHPLYKNYPFTGSGVTNRFYVYKDNLSRTTGVVDLDGLQDNSLNNSCDAPKSLPSNGSDGWFINLNRNGTGEQVVTSSLIVTGLVTFSTNRPIPPASGTCSTTLGEARGYWLNLLNGAGAIGVAGTCGGSRSSPFIGGGLPPSPVLATSVPVDGKAVTVTIGTVDRHETDANTPVDNKADSNTGDSTTIGPDEHSPHITTRRRRTFSHTSVD
jgi:type IV pilus assembly protein PilY1